MTTTVFKLQVASPLGLLLSAADIECGRVRWDDVAKFPTEETAKVVRDGYAAAWPERKYRIIKRTVEEIEVCEPKPLQEPLDAPGQSYGTP